MSISREYSDGPIKFLCDNPKCVEIDETHTTNFSSALAKLKSHGWTLKCEKTFWRQYCRDCSNV